MDVWVISSSYPRRPDESVNAGVVARDVALSLSEVGHRVTVVTPAKPGGIAFDPALQGIVLPWLAPSLALADLSAKNPWDVLRMLSLFALAPGRLRRTIRQSRRPDAVIALWAIPSGIFARRVKRLTGAPYVVWVLGSDVWKAPRFPGGRRMFRAVLGDAERAFADGSELAAAARALSGRDVEFLPSCRRLPPPPADGLPDPVDVLFVGRYHPNKGPDVLLDAFELLRPRRPGATVRLHGQGSMRGALERRARGLGAGVDVLGPVSAVELSGTMARAGVLAIPSRIESIPLILGDATQAGLPVVASAVGDMGEVVEKYGLGRVVPPEDPVALAEALDAALTEPRRLDAGSGPGWLSPDGVADALLEGFRATPGSIERPEPGPS